MELLNVNKLNCLYEYKDAAICTIRLLFNAGSIEESEEIYGAAHYLEHMFFQGTKKMKRKELIQELSRLGENNAGTYQDKTVYYIDCLSENWSKALNLLLEMVFDNKYLQSDFEKEKGVILEERQMYLDSPTDFFQENSSLYSFGEAMHYIIGTKESISGMTAKSLENFKDRFYSGANMVVMVAGKIDKKKLKEELLKIRAKYADRFIGNLELTKLCSFQLSKGDCNFSHNSEQAHIAYFFPVVDLEWKKKTMPESEIFETCFGGGGFSVLYEELREKMGLCYSVYYWEQYCRSNAVISLYSQLDKKNVGKARSKIDSIIKKVKKEGFDKKIIETSKKNCVFKMKKMLESARDIVSLNMNFYSLGLFDTDKYVEDMLKVTNDDIIEYANIVLSDDRKFICMIGK